MHHAVNQLQATWSYFPPASFIGVGGGPNNLELTAGLQVNSFAGAGSGNLRAGVGPVGGIALKPWQNVEIQLIKGTFDNRNRGIFQTGIQVYFGTRGNESLKDLRRKYLEPTNLSGTAGTFWH